jgi:hypothetical protein
MSMKRSTSRTIAGLLFLAATLTVINVAYLYFYLDYRYPIEKEEIVDWLRDNTTLVSPFVTPSTPSLRFLYYSPKKAVVCTGFTVRAALVVSRRGSLASTAKRDRTR